MPAFARFARLVHERYTLLAKHELFVTHADNNLVWDVYLQSFPAGTNEIYRERTEHDCSCCKQFIRNIGNVVAIIDGRPQSVWAVEGAEYPYDVVAQAMDFHVLSAPITNLYRSKERQYGQEQNFELLADGNTKQWKHFHGRVQDKHFSLSPAAAIGEYAGSAQVFRRGLEELNPAVFDTILDLIQGNALYRGEEHKASLLAFQALQNSYLALTTAAAKNTFVWANATKPATRLRNTAIGTLVQDLSDGVDLERAVASFEAKVAPTNYKRTSALITPAMVKQAMTTINEMGLESALERRFATIHDISVNNVLWVDGSVQGQMKGGIENLLMEAAAPVASTSKQVPEEITIDDFMAHVVPKAKSIDAFVAGSMQSNFMSLTAPVHADAKQLFKWDNNFGWSYNGNITDSIKEKVKRAGGNTNAKLRVSLSWFNPDDLDIHCYAPEGHIAFNNKCGVLDVDMNAWGPKSATDPVENLSWVNPRDGKYRVAVHQYTCRTKDRPGFVIEVENNGQLSQYSYQNAVSNTVEAIAFTVKGGIITNLSVCPGLVGGGISQEKWGITTEQFVKVNTLMFSPNHWDGQCTGNKHWFFLLDDCLNDEPARGLYNEFLLPELNTHRKVFEVLGSKTMCQPTQEQLSGLGFSSTKGDSLLVQVTNDTARKTYNISF